MTFKNLFKIQPFGCPLQRRRFSENPYKTLAVRTKIKVRALKKTFKNTKKSIPSCPPKKHRKKHSQNWFWHPFWAPKAFQNAKKIHSKTMFEKEAKKKRKNCPQDPPCGNPPPLGSTSTCLSKEREARRHMRAVEACKAKAEDLKVGWTAENSPNDHKTTKNN